MQPQSSGGPNSVQSPLNGSEQSNLLPHSPQAQVSNTTTSPGDVTLNLNPQGNTTNRNDNNKAEAKPQKRKTLLNQDKWPIIFWGTSDLLGLITTIVAGVSVLALLITLIILLAYHFGEKETDLTSTAGALSYMSFNLNADPIIRLSLSINGKCPSGTDKTYLGTWPGTSDGCNCPVIGMKAEKCADKQKSVCSDVSSIDSAQLFRWEDSFLCVRRAKINSEYMKAVNCSEGFKSCCQDADPSKCSVGICMRKDLDCPLTAINIQTTGAQEDFLDTDKYISSSRDPTGNAIVDITISNNDVPCFSMNQTVEGKGDYVLLNAHPGCSAYGKDEFSKKIDSSPQTDVINFNGLSKDILELPGYKPITDSTTSYLSARTRITVANHDECLGLNTKIMDDASAAALNLNKYINGTSIAAIAAHGLLIILLCASFGFAVMQEKSWIQALYGKTSGLWLAVYVLMMFIELCVYIVMTALVKSARSVLVDAQDYLGHLSELGCFPTGTPKEVIQDCHSIAGTVSAKLNGFAVALLVLTLVTYVPIVAVIVYKNVFKR